MFRFVISLFFFPVLFLLVVSGTAAGICVLLLSGETIAGTDAASHSAKAAVYFLTASGLTCSVICTSVAPILVILSFVFKSRINAALYAAITAGGFFLWNYFLSIPYFL